MTTLDRCRYGGGFQIPWDPRQTPASESTNLEGDCNCANLFSEDSVLVVDYEEPHTGPPGDLGTGLCSYQDAGCESADLDTAADGIVVHEGTLSYHSSDSTSVEFRGNVTSTQFNNDAPCSTTKSTQTGQSTSEWRIRWNCTEDRWEEWNGSSWDTFNSTLWPTQTCAGLIPVDGTLCNDESGGSFLYYVVGQIGLVAGGI